MATDPQPHDLSCGPGESEPPGPWLRALQRVVVVRRGEVAAAVHGQGALLSLNHPVLDLGDVCIGCAWKHDLDGIAVDAVEIGTGGQMQGAVLFTPGAIKFWEGLLGKGRHVAAVGGSDDHLAGKGTGRRDSPIGDPTTLIFAEELSVPAILGGLQGGRTVVKLQGPSDPMIEFGAGDLRVGDTLSGRSAILTARIKGGLGGSARFVTNGVAEDSVVIDADPFVLQRDVTASRPASQGADGSGEDRFRVEVIDVNIALHEVEVRLRVDLPTGAL